MSQRRCLLLLFAGFLTDFVACRKNDGNLSGCFDGKVVKSVEDQRGVITYDPSEKRYGVQVHLAGTIDAVDTGFFCENLDSLKKEGRVIRFRGDYLSYPKERRPPIGGTTYYYLHIKHFEIVK